MQKSVALRKRPAIPRQLKIEKFWAIYLCAVIVLVFAVIIWLTQLHRMMVAYEASMPYHQAQEVVSALEQGDYRSLYNKLDAVAQGESEAQFSAYLSGKIQRRPISYAASHAPSAEEKIFTLSTDAAAFAKITLTQTEGADAFGNRGWALKSVTMPNIVTDEYFLTVPDEYTAFVDDKQLGEESIVERNIPMEHDGHLPEKKVHVPTYTKYRVARSFSEPKFRVLDKKGNEAAIESPAKGEFKAGLQYDESVRKSQSKRAVEIAKAYGLFSIGRLSKQKFLAQILPGTAAYDMIYKYDERWFVKNSGYKFTKVKASKFYPYSKNCYSCEVTYELVLKAANGKKQTYPTKLTLYMFKTDKFKVYDMVISQ